MSVAFSPNLGSNLEKNRLQNFDLYCHDKTVFYDIGHGSRLMQDMCTYKTFMRKKISQNNIREHYYLFEEKQNGRRSASNPCRAV